MDRGEALEESLEKEEALEEVRRFRVWRRSVVEERRWTDLAIWERGTIGGFDRLGERGDRWFWSFGGEGRYCEKEKRTGDRFWRRETEVIENLRFWVGSMRRI